MKTKPAWEVRNVDVLQGLGQLLDDSIHCCVTSPPYWGLRDYGCDGQLGLEATPEEYIANMVKVFAEVKRVLRPDGTLWLNIGDSYARNPTKGGSGPGKNSDYSDSYGKSKSIAAKQYRMVRAMQNKIDQQFECKEKDLVGIPWMLAFALRADGWYLRSEIIWHKRSPMPESVRDRPTKAHEQVFLLTKSQTYFYDNVASAEKAVVGSKGSTFTQGKTGVNGQGRQSQAERADGETRNMRSVWTLSNESFKGAHFATMPTELARRCLVAGTSERGCCPQCGAPWERRIEKVRVSTRPGTNSKVNRASDDEDSPYNGHGGSVVGNRDPNRHVTRTETIGWEPGCKCGISHLPVACTALDPFGGAGTTVMVARRLGLKAIAFELNPEYAEMARERIREDAPLFN